jgi:uncharacterized protein YjbJ (UPF0337 family)
MTDRTANYESTTGSATGKTKDVAGTARDQAGSVASKAMDEASTVADDAKFQARRLADQSRGELRRSADEQAHRLAETLRDISGQLHEMARGEAPAPGLVSDVTHQAAGSTQRMAQRLDDKGMEGVLDDVKQFARRRPGVFVLGALGAGVVAGRLLRALDTDAIMQAAKPSGGSGQSTYPQQASAMQAPSAGTTRLPGDPAWEASRG